MTHGPAIRTSGRPAAKSANSIGTGEERLLLVGEAAHVLVVRGADERSKERVRLHRLGLELRVELAAEETGGAGDLADLDVGAVGGLAGEAESAGLQLLFVLPVELIAVAVALVDFAGAVGLVGEAVRLEAAGPRPETHGAAELVDPLQLAKLVDDAVGRARVELGGVGVVEAADVPREFDDERLHAEADAEVRDLILAGVADRVEHAVDAAFPEAAGNQDRVIRVELPLPAFADDALCFEPVDVDLDLVRHAAVNQRFLETLVRVLVLDIFADDPD